MTIEKPLDWMVNERASGEQGTRSLDRILPVGPPDVARGFHNQIPGFRSSPLAGLSNLASMLGLGGIWVKDEALRLDLNSFKVLGGSYAIYRYLERKLGSATGKLTFDELTGSEVRDRLGSITFATATDGNHGRGVAWAAQVLGQRAVIYVHSKTTTARIRAIEDHGGEVKIIEGTYDDAVRRIEHDASKHGWQIISDTSWEGYEEIPTWIMQGYTTLFAEAEEQLAEAGAGGPTHVLVQGGVGALAAAAVGYYRRSRTDSSPVCIVVEPTKAACLLASARIGDGKPHTFAGELDTIMAGLACGEPSPLAWDLLWDHTDAFVAVPDYVAAKGMRVFGVPLDGDPTVISGESGAVTLGTLMFLMEAPEGKRLRDAVGFDAASQVLLVNTEGDTDPDYFRRVVWEGANAVPEKYRWTPSVAHG